jgi:hypothetical protein
VFTDKPIPGKSELDKAIDNAFLEMQGFTADEEGYSKIVDQLSKLYALKPEKAKQRVSPDTVWIVVGNLLGIAVIVGHERANVVSSKALNFIMKLK